MSLGGEYLCWPAGCCTLSLDRYDFVIMCLLGRPFLRGVDRQGLGVGLGTQSDVADPRSRLFLVTSPAKTEVTLNVSVNHTTVMKIPQFLVVMFLIIIQLQRVVELLLLCGIDTRIGPQWDIEFASG